MLVAIISDSIARCLLTLIIKNISQLRGVTKIDDSLSHWSAHKAREAILCGPRTALYGSSLQF